MISSSDSDSDDFSPKRKKRAPMFYKRYAVEDGVLRIPRTTRLRMAESAEGTSEVGQPGSSKQNAQSSRNNTSSKSDRNESNPDNQQLYDGGYNPEPSKDTDGSSEDRETVASGQELSDESSHSDSSQKSNEDAISYFGLNASITESQPLDQLETSDASKSAEESKSEAESSHVSSSEKESSDSSDGESDESEARPTLKLGDFDSLRKRHKLDEPLIPDVVKTSKFETLLMVLCFALQEGLSDVGIGSLLKLINQVFGQVVIPDSVKTFRSIFECDLGMSHHIYCSSCKCYIGNHSSLKMQGNNFTCPVSSCKRKGTLKKFNDGNFFIYIPLEPQLKVFLESKKNVNELLLYRFSREQSDNTIRDVFDGELYKKLLGPGGFLNDPYNLSVTLNTDGSPIFKSVKNTMWPIQCRLNELPPKDRFESDNMFVCGVWFGKEEPDMNLFLSQYVKESCLLYSKGFDWKLNSGETVTSHVVTLNACLDSRAKPDVQCHKQLHSYNGCSYCFHPGDLVNLKRNVIASQIVDDSEEDAENDDPAEMECEETEQTGERKKKREVKAVRYCVSSGGFHTERKDADIRDDMRKSAEDGKVHRGIRGISVMMLIPQFDLVHGFVIDYMHCILLGVVKTCLNLWLDRKYSTKPFSLVSKLNEINSRLLNLRPPSNISRRPRSLSEYVHFKANELRAWLFFYCLPCIKGLLPEFYFKHFSLLVTAMAILCSDCMSFGDLERAKGYLELFVADFEKLYGPAFMVHNIHITSHLPLIVKYSGPSWSHSAFSFESGNGILTNLVKGTVGVISQIARKYMTYRCAPLIVEYFSVSEVVLDYCESLVPKRMCKNVSRYNGITLLGMRSISPLTNPQIEILRKAKIPSSVSCYFRFIKRDSVYHSLNYPKQGMKSYDSAVKMVDGNFGVIERIFVHAQNVYVIVRHLLLEPNNYVSRHESSGARCTHIKVCAFYPFGTLKVVRAETIMSKCVLLKHGHSCYVAEFPNVFEKD